MKFAFCVEVVFMFCTEVPLRHAPRTQADSEKQLRLTPTYPLLAQRPILSLLNGGVSFRLRVVVTLEVTVCVPTTKGHTGRVCFCSM